MSLHYLGKHQTWKLCLVSLQHLCQKLLKSLMCMVCLYCCKNKQPTLWREGDFGVSVLQNTWTDWHKIWHGWLITSVIPPCIPNSKQLPYWGHPGIRVKYHSYVIFSFFPFCHPKFAHIQPAEPIYTWFDSYDITYRLLHSWRDNNAKRFRFP